jgi:hypothetical protein
VFAKTGHEPTFNFPFLHFPDNGIIFAENQVSERNSLSYEKTMDKLDKHKHLYAAANFLAEPDKTR